MVRWNCKDMGRQLMARPIIKEVNLVEGSEIEREMNDDEFLAWETEQVKIAQEEADKAAKIAAKAALLDRLGVTEEEATLLLG
jgi:hypothetical protein